MKPAARPMSSRTPPIDQLISRGRRNAPVKNTRNMCTVMDATKISADQWCTWRMSSPPRTSKLMSSVEAYASDIGTPRSGT